jgi:GNAT superfamily N-acetyltransferase
MKLEIASPDQVKELVRLSKAAFDSDFEVGAPEVVGGPPYYDSVQWHVQQLEQGTLYAALENDLLVGGALLFRSTSKPGTLYVGRIFIDPLHFRKGCGIRLMEAIERVFPNTVCLCLDTPIWNRRTNSFYKKLGYCAVRTDEQFVYYEKRL